MTHTYTVYGEPAPQGSKKHVGNGVMVESSKKVKPWREAIVWQVKPKKMIEGAVCLSLWFYLPRPKSVKRKYPTVKPDIDKLERSTLDGLKSAGLYRDDAQVVYVVKRKAYVGTYAGMDRPGVIIEVVELA